MKIAILGIGHMGSWLARELKKKNKIAVYDLDKSKINGIADVKVLSNLSDLGLFNPELLINAVTLQNTIKAFEESLKNISKTCIICDVASVKGEISAFYAKSGFRFVSLHPMFGPTFADMDSLKEENLVIIKESDENGKEFFKDFFRQYGLNQFEYTFEEHDKMMTYSLTLPFISSMVFAACAKSGIVPGTTFARHKKIAKGLLSEDHSLLSEILFNQHSIEQLNQITAQLEFLKHVIKAKDYDEMRKVFEKLRKNLGD
ncbi:MAG: prephenate dehydrogenase/arogenate dehydrogenase family protein [Candidatus Hydromicrobium americanum]|nr:MAG: prephenate dehydrogenase/arogenate dehydrogenase family protein [Candidatus Hydromicrobium americanum]